MFLWLSYKKKIWIPKVTEEIIRIRSWIGPDPDPVVRGTDPRIRIRTKKSLIPNTEKKRLNHFFRNPCRTCHK
jgi:hypothetical protein